MDKIRSHLRKIANLKKSPDASSNHHQKNPSYLLTMAKRRVKKRTHAGARTGAPNGAANTKNMDRSPRSMVIRIGAGEVGPSVSQLVKDVRQVMEPDTAARLKVWIGDTEGYQSTC